MKAERRNRNIGLIASGGVHLALLIIFLLMMAWRAPNPPYPEYGIELNFGLDSQGSGEVQPDTPASASAAEEQSDEEPPEEVIEEAAETEVEEEEESPVEQVQAGEQPVSKLESPVVVTETKQSKPVVKEQEKPKEEVARQPVVAEVKKTDTQTKAAEEAAQQGEKPANHGDNVNTVGDKGSKEGTLDAKALYGNAGGGGGGVGLDLAGWDWDNIPRPQIPGNESDGKIEFEIKVDDNGDIIGYRVLERSLSIEAEKACRDAISKLTFSKKPGAVVPAVSVGKITFVVRTR